MKLFDDSLPFYKANLHTHTTESDGRLSPQESMRTYRSLGYSILAITDHRRVTLPEAVPEGLLLIPGIELDYLLPSQAVHILGLGVDDTVTRRWDRNGSPQQGVSAIRAAGGRAVLAHPAWSLNTPDMIASLRGLTGVEIWNSASTFPINADRADSSSILDITSASHGTLLNVLANDDTHSYTFEVGGGFTMIQPEALTEEGVLRALDAGRFYASRGPLIRQVELENGIVRVRCSPASLIAFITNVPWSPDRCVTGSALTEASYTVSPSDRFLRIQVVDENGRSAWSSPIDVSR